MYLYPIAANTKIGEIMKKLKKINLIFGALALLTGFINGLLGAGGGMVTVPLLKKIGLDQKSAQQNAIAVILPITLLSSIVYLARSYVSIGEPLPYIPGGLLGAAIGTWLMKKISNKILRYIFAAFMLYAGIRLLFK